MMQWKKILEWERKETLIVAKIWTMQIIIVGTGHRCRLGIIHHSIKKKIGRWSILNRQHIWDRKQNFNMCLFLCLLLNYPGQLDWVPKKCLNVSVLEDSLVSIKCLPHKREHRSSTSSTHSKKQSKVACTCHPSTGDADTGGYLGCMGQIT